MARAKKNATRNVKTPKNSINNMKYEIANEFGVNLGANASSRDNGIVGGEMTKRLVENGMNKTSNSNSKKTTSKSKSSTNKRTKKSK